MRSVRPRSRECTAVEGTSGSGGFPNTPPGCELEYVGARSNVEQVAKCVSQEACAQYGQGDDRTGRQGEPDRSIHETVPFAKHRAPAWGRWLDAKSQEAEVRLGQDRRPDGD